MSNTLKLGAGKWATGTDTVLAFNDENNNFKPLPFSFSRASSATVVNQSGLIETVGSGEPRIDFLGNTKGALLLEPSRTNLVTKSENIQDWNRASNATAEFGYEDPFKGNKAVKLTSSSTAQSYQVYQSTGALSIGSTYTFSMYAKKGTGHIFRLDFGIPDNGFVHIDLRDGSLLQESGSTYYDGYKVEPMSNGWYRISMISTLNSSAYYRAGLYQQQGDCYVAFAQIEQGSYATSYIPTSGQSGGVTRLADSCSDAGNEQVINSTEGVLYAEISALANPTSQEIALSVSEGQSGANRLLIRMKTNGEIGIVLRVSNTTEASIDSGVLDQSVNHKVAVKWKVNDIALWIDGVKVGVDSSANVFSANTLDEASFNQGNNSNQFYGNCKDLRVYNTALTDQELIALTS